MPTDAKKTAAAQPEPTPIRRPDYSKPNPTRSVDIELEDGRTRRLRLDFEALYQIEEQTGLKLYEGAAWDEVRHSIKTMAIVLREALAHEDPDLTVEQVRRMDNVNLANLPYIQNRFFALYGMTLPDADEETAESTAEGNADPNPASGPDSTTSGLTPLWSSDETMTASGS